MSLPGDVELGKFYFCKDGRIRKIIQVGLQKRFPWEKRVQSEIVHGRMTRTKKSKLSMQTIRSYILTEVPAEYTDRLEVFPAIYWLKETLREIEENDKNYDKREVLIYRAMAYAREAGITAGFRMDSRNNDPSGYFWPVATIDLPTGQVSWHMPGYDKEYDGHDTCTKYCRIREWVNA